MLLLLACVLVLIGMIKGLVRILIGLAALVAAFAAAARYHGPLAGRLDTFEISPEALSLIAFLLIFLGVMLAGGLIAWLMRRLIKAAMLGWADRLGGAALGLAMATLMAALVILPIVAYSPWGERLLVKSVLAPYVTVVADVANRMVPEDLSVRYEQRIENIRRFWRDQLFADEV